MTGEEVVDTLVIELIAHHTLDDIVSSLQRVGPRLFEMPETVIATHAGLMNTMRTSAEVNENRAKGLQRRSEIAQMIINEYTSRGIEERAILSKIKEKIALLEDEVRCAKLSCSEIHSQSVIVDAELRTLRASIGKTSASVKVHKQLYTSELNKLNKLQSDLERNRKEIEVARADAASTESMLASVLDKSKLLRERLSHERVRMNETSLDVHAVRIREKRLQCFLIDWSNRQIHSES